MSRKIWIAVLGFGFVLFLLLDLVMLWYAMTHAARRNTYGAVLILLFGSWQVYLALRRRIDSKEVKSKRKKA